MERGTNSLPVRVGDTSVVGHWPDLLLMVLADRRSAFDVTDRMPCDVRVQDSLTPDTGSCRRGHADSLERAAPEVHHSVTRPENVPLCRELGLLV